MYKSRAGKILTITTLLLSPVPAFAQGLTFGIVSKSISDPNFIATWQGCQDAAAAQDDRCLHIGDSGAAHPRNQVTALTAALEKNRFDALAISVTRSEHVARALKNSNIPVITFDSPFNQQYASLSESYVGMDNLQVGRDIAKLARQLYPYGATVCLMTTAHDPNHAQRINGIRQELSGNTAFPPETLLNGENNWHECTRSPWNTADNMTRTMDEISYTLSTIQPDLLISTGHWPVIDIARYQQEVQPYKERLTSGKTKMLVTIGENDGIDLLLDQRLIHGYVKLDFYNIGRQSYRLMRTLAENQPTPESLYIPNYLKSINTRQ